MSDLDMQPIPADNLALFAQVENDVTAMSDLGAMLILGGAKKMKAEGKDSTAISMAMVAASADIFARCFVAGIKTEKILEQFDVMAPGLRTLIQKYSAEYSSDLDFAEKANISSQGNA